MLEAMEVSVNIARVEVHEDRYVEEMDTVSDRHALVVADVEVEAATVLG